MARKIAYLEAQGKTELAAQAERELQTSPAAFYRDVDHSTLNRVVVDRIADEEMLIHGKADTTFREAALEYWGFSRIDRDSRWIILDDAGNDITDSPLSSFAGIAAIAAEGEMQSAPLGSGEEVSAAVGSDESEGSEEEETFSSIDSGVEFYD